MPTRVFIFDLDGTICNNSHRQHYVQGEKKDWDAFSDACGLDTPHIHILELAQVLARSYMLIFLTGRSIRAQALTEDWLRQYGLWSGPRLFMRAEGDYRPDDVIKSELMDRILAEGYEVIMAFDDRTSVVKMWRARGIPCAQVADGDF